MDTTTRPTIAPGTTVIASLHMAGGCHPRLAGTLACIVLSGGGHEYDLMLHPAQDLDDAQEILEFCDCNIFEMRCGPVVLLPNMQADTLCVPTAAALRSGWGIESPR